MYWSWCRVIELVGCFRCVCYDSKLYSTRLVCVPLTRSTMTSILAGAALANKHDSRKRNRKKVISKFSHDFDYAFAIYAFLCTLQHSLYRRTRNLTISHLTCVGFAKVYCQKIWAAIVSASQNFRPPAKGERSGSRTPAGILVISNLRSLLLGQIGPVVFRTEYLTRTNVLQQLYIIWIFCKLLEILPSTYGPGSCGSLPLIIWTLLTLVFRRWRRVVVTSPRDFFLTTFGVTEGCKTVICNP